MSVLRRSLVGSSPAPMPATEPARSDMTLISAVLQGDQAAFAVLVERWGPRVHRAVLRMVGNPDDAADLTQETFLRVYCALASYDPTYAFSTWVYRIAANLAINHRRRRGRETTVGRTIEAQDTFFESLLDEDVAALPEPAWDEAELTSRLWAAVDRLPDDYRTVIVLRHVMVLNYDDMCAVTGLPMGTVKSRLARARRMLAARMADG